VGTDLSLPNRFCEIGLDLSPLSNIVLESILTKFIRPVLPSAIEPLINI